MKKYNVKNYIRYKEDLKKSMPDDKFYDYYTRDELIIKFLPLVENLARKFSTTQQASGVLSINDLIQIGSEGLTKAVDKLDWFMLSDAEDIEKTLKLIETIKPHQIYAAGDLADPHGTHKVCLDIIFEALKQLKTKKFMNDCWVWLYRGAWHEWEIHEIEMAVPMSPDQVLRKRKAIFYHQSQKDGVMFQGNDNREFWVRAEERNAETANKYKKMGLADYAAMEAFKRYYF